MVQPPGARPNPRPPEESPYRSRGLGAKNFNPRSIEDQQPKRVTGGKISTSRHISAVDEAARLHSYAPGPGAYHTKNVHAFALPEGGRVSRQPPSEKTKPFDEYPRPSPAEYGCPNDPNKPRAVYGEFGKDPRHTEFIRQAVKVSAGNPAPGAHEIQVAMEYRSNKPFCPDGGRFSTAKKPASYFEQAAKLAENKPAPDAYNQPSSMDPNPKGKQVWRYESATMEETKRLVTKMVGASNEAPGPGTYNAPDPPVIAQAPTLKGRELSHGMPAPFAYNCKPDLSRRFLRSVRDQNSGAQIFGRDLRQPSEAGIGSAGRSESTGAIMMPSQASGGRPDEIEAEEMPFKLMEEDPTQDYASQWKPGGFRQVPRARSTGAIKIKKKEHPVVEQTRAHYKALSRQMGRKLEDRTFLPGCHKRNNGYEPVGVGDRSQEYRRLQEGKAQLASVADKIDELLNTASAASALEPLDEGKLRRQALEGLLDKAKERMRNEGVAQDQQDLVLAEFPVVLEKQFNQFAPGVTS